MNNPNPCLCPPPLPDDPAILKIPLRLPPGVIPSFRPDDVILKDGDVVYIESRDAEVFYTGGLLPGGEYQIPRDYDLDVLGQWRWLARAFQVRKDKGAELEFRASVVFRRECSISCDALHATVRSRLRWT